MLIKPFLRRNLNGLIRVTVTVLPEIRARFVLATMSQNCRGKILFSRFFFFFFLLIRQILLIEISRSLEIIAIYFADSSLISRGAKRETRGPDPPLITFLAPWQRDSSGVCRWQRRRCRTIIHAKTQRSCFATDYSLLRCASISLFHDASTRLKCVKTLFDFRKSRLKSLFSKLVSLEFLKPKPSFYDDYAKFR